MRQIWTKSGIFGILMRTTLHFVLQKIVENCLDSTKIHRLKIKQKFLILVL